MNTIRLERRDRAANLARFYAVSVVPALLGGWAVVREWGRIGSPGRVRTDWFPTEAEAEAAATHLVTLKMRHGYQAHPADLGCSIRTPAG
jgi:predicted DNA-binding WGR domain protein